MSTALQTMTAEEFFALASQGKRMDLIDGEVVEMAPSGAEQGGITVSLSWIMMNWVKRSNHGKLFAQDTGFILARDPDVVLCPDIAYIRNEHLPKSGIPKGFFELVPDLVVEIVSPSDRYTDVEVKVERWLAAGVPLVWIVNPRLKQVKVYQPGSEAITLRSTDDLTGCEVLPGFTCRVSELFE